MFYNLKNLAHIYTCKVDSRLLSYSVQKGQYAYMAICTIYYMLIFLCSGLNVGPILLLGFAPVHEDIEVSKKKAQLLCINAAY